MAFTAETWPIGAALLQFPGVQRDGTVVQDAPAARWSAVLAEIAAAGFDHVDLTDSWLRPGDLTPDRREEFATALRGAGLGVTAISVVRRSPIDPDPATAEENLAYLHRTIDAAAELDIPVVCAGLHRPFTAAQRAALWFWTEPGPRDPLGDERTRARCVRRFREVGEHAAERGIAVSLEMYEDTYLGTADGAVALVTDIGLDNVGLNPDIGNIVRLHRPVEDWARMLELTLPHANYWHVKNYHRDHDPATGAYFSVPAPMEQGVISYRLAIEIALENGFNGPICVEHYGGDGLSVSARNRDYLRGLLRVKLGER
ncbi:sugar phosphate isomerase/epimerase [Saccharopolyspora gloriosae]|uniref:sugar phosphate isomerase/epimerase family protein n=1 Tax=Saccharopolyspora gloriosae TaxID=455344 RepID=UPI001FB6C98D|nr:sugar phosphate isomerase/epimerase family protein [Saccharopolyspora gloriosae]